jgi:hypothetical protein
MQITAIPRPQFATLGHVFAALLAGNAGKRSPAMLPAGAQAIAVPLGAVDAKLLEPLARIAHGSTKCKARGA